jgi:hypothetical protein
MLYTDVCCTQPGHLILGIVDSGLSTLAFPAGSTQSALDSNCTPVLHAPVGPRLCAAFGPLPCPQSPGKADGELPHAVLPVLR